MENFEKIVLIFFASNYLTYIPFQFSFILRMTMKEMRYHLVKNKEVWVPVWTVNQQSVAYHLGSLNLRFFLSGQHESWI